MEILRVGAAIPDPPFNGMPDNTGLDIDLMTEVAKALGVDVEFIAYKGSDFDGIFDGLNDGAYDCVTAGPTVTPERETKAQFVPPYLISGQSLAVDTTRLPHVRSIDDLAGLTIGVQQGNTSQPIADRLVAAGKAARVRVYDYGAIRCWRSSARHAGSGSARRPAARPSCRRRQVACRAPAGVAGGAGPASGPADDERRCGRPYSAPAVNGRSQGQARRYPRHRVRGDARPARRRLAPSRTRVPAGRAVPVAG